MPQISEVQMQLVDAKRPDGRLKAFATICLENALVIRDLKIIFKNGRSFVAMPNRKITDKCNHCGTKNHLRAHFCNHCGEKLQDDRAPKGADGKQKLYADIVHPIHSACREEISTTVLSAYQAAVRRQMELARITFNGPHVVDIQQLSDDQCEQEDP